MIAFTLLLVLPVTCFILLILLGHDDLHVVAAQSASSAATADPSDVSSCASSSNVFDLMGQWVDDAKRDADAFFAEKGIFVDRAAEDVMTKIAKVWKERSQEDTAKLQSWMESATARLTDFFAEDDDDKGLKDVSAETVADGANSAGVGVGVGADASASAGNARSSFDEPPLMVSGHDLFEGITKLMSSMASGVAGTNEAAAENTVMQLVEGAKTIADGYSVYEKRTFKQTLSLFTTAFDLVGESVKSHFGDIELTKFNPLSFFYYLELEDERKNPSWKRRNHRFLKTVKPDEVVELHESFYLAELAYVDSIEEIRTGLVDTEWELVYGKIDASPAEPGHYLALKKAQAKGSEYLDVLLSVRGTKEIGDLLSDAFLDADSYRGGKAHAGVKLAGQYLVQKHTHLLERMLELSGKKKVNLAIVGHSLGAGAGSIAAIEFNDNPLIEANTIGFGCPALLSKDLAEQDFIVTVISDSDVVPRMSGASVRNTLFDIMAYDWSDFAFRDVQLLVNAAKESFKPIPISDNFEQSLLNFVKKTLDDTIKPAVAKIQEQYSERVEPELIPPGRCVHFYRDGSGMSARHTPCSQFDSIEVTRHLIDDHMTPQGYHRAMLYYMRDVTNDIHYRFAHDTLF